MEAQAMNEVMKNLRADGPWVLLRVSRSRVAVNYLVPWWEYTVITPLDKKKKKKHMKNINNNTTNMLWFLPRNFKDQKNDSFSTVYSILEYWCIN